MRCNPAQQYVLSHAQREGTGRVELEKVLECYVDIASNILKYEPLMIVTRDIEECKADIARITESPLGS